MKKTLLAVAALFALNTSIGFAAPINNLGQGQTAIGISNDTFYLEHKFSDTFTLGFQNIDWTNTSDIYGQFRLSSNLRGIIGSRNFDSNSKVYFGLSVNGPISSATDGYASLIAGEAFKELQLGANIPIAHNTELNINYHSYMPDYGGNNTGIGAGVTFKF